MYYVYSAYNANEYTVDNAYSQGDATHYLKIAENLVCYGVFSDNNSSEPTQSAIWRPPVWPLILSVFYFFTSNIVGLIILKSLVETSLVFVAIKVVKRKLKLNYLQCTPFFLLLIEPQYIKYSITFLSESITAVFLLLFSLTFIFFNSHKKKSYLIILFGVLTVLTHPVSVFFVGTLLFSYGLMNLKAHTIRVILQALLFFLLFFLWPLRNYYTFNEGVILTASQGAVFSKGWNKKVYNEFNNVDGDLADEELNFEDYPPNPLLLKEASLLELSKLYRVSTWKYINSLTLKETLKVIGAKLLSNFNPIPMKPKPTFLDGISIPFRVIYIVIFLQALYLLLFKNKLEICMTVYYSCLVILAIIIGQVLMSIYTYTGLRFNSIYGLSLVLTGLLINFKRILALVYRELTTF